MQHRRNHQAWPCAVHELVEAGVGSGEGRRRTVAEPATPVRVPQPPTAPVAPVAQVPPVAQVAPVASVPPVAPAVPSWRQVLATTIGLWVARRLPLAGAGRRPASGRPHPGGPGPGRHGGAGFRWPARLRHRPSARSLRLPILAVAVAVLRFTGTSSPVARSPAPGGTHPARAGYGAGAPAGTAALVRSQAAA